MQLSDWIPSLTTGGAVLALAWLARKIITTHLAASVEHKFNTRLESLRADLRASEERLKADLRQREIAIRALHDVAMTAISSRQVALDRRRLEAVDQIWSAATSLGPAKAVSAVMAVTNFEFAASEAKHDPRVRDLFGSLGFGGAPDLSVLATAEKARPFVTPMVWATYSAMASICMQAMLRRETIRSGIGPRDFANHRRVQELIALALPHRTPQLSGSSHIDYHPFIAELEDRLLDELRSMLEGDDVDEARIAKAREILNAVAAVQETADRNPLNPTGFADESTTS